MNGIVANYLGQWRRPCVCTESYFFDDTSAAQIHSCGLISGGVL